MSTLIVREARAQHVEFGADTLIVHLEDGRSIITPLEWFPRLRDASEAERSQWRLIGRGVGIHWEALDEDLSVRGLLEGAARHGRVARRRGRGQGCCAAGAWNLWHTRAAHPQSSTRSATPFLDPGMIRVPISLDHL